MVFIKIKRLDSLCFFFREKQFAIYMKAFCFVLFFSAFFKSNASMHNGVFSLFGGIFSIIALT